jgi:hypothetical protein
MTRNTLRLVGDPDSWIASDATVDQLSQLQEESLLCLTKKVRRQWVSSVEDKDRLEDILSQTPSYSSEDRGEAEFVVGLHQGGEGPKLPVLFAGSDWRKSLQSRRFPLGHDESAQSAWSRVYGGIVPKASKIDIVDGYIINDLMRRSSVLEDIFRSGFEGFAGEITLHFIRPREIKDPDGNPRISLPALASRLKTLRSYLGGTAQRKFSANLYRKNFVQENVKGGFGSDNHERLIYFSFDSQMGILNSLGKGIESFSSQKTFSSVSDQPASAWPRWSSTLAACRDDVGSITLRDLLG